MSKIGKYIALLIGGLVIATGSLAQTYSPIPVTGFNQDGIAESGIDATAVTTTALDLSSYIMYSTTFAAINGLLAGLPNSGTIVSGTRTWQLQPYTGNNVLYLSAGGAQVNTAASGNITLTTPAMYSAVNLLLFATEDHANINVVMNFTDGTTFNAGNFNILDWFGGAGAVYAAYGRTTRLNAPPYTTFGVGTGDPRFYQLNLPLSCVNKNKLLQSLTISYLNGNTTFGRLVVLALSGVGYTPPTITPVITQATCGNANGSIGLTVTGGTAPYTYAWNTTPVKTTALANNLGAGSYTCTIREADNCTVTYSGTVPSSPVAILTPTATPSTVCAGEAVNLSVSATGGTVSTYTWNPGNVTGNNVSVAPTATTTYTVSGTDNNGCAVSASVPVTVRTLPASTFIITPANVCLGTPQIITYTGNASGTATYDWFGFAGATVQSGSGQGPYTILFNNPATYNLQLQVTDNGCVSTITTNPVIISTPVSSAFSVSDSVICAGSTITATYTGSGAGYATATWGWGGGTVQSGSGFGPYTVKYNRSGIINLTVRDGACVSVARSRLINVLPSPVAAFTPDTKAGCTPYKVTFNNQSQNTDAWKWTFGDGGTSTSVSPSYTYNNTGVYTVTLIVSSQGKCSDTLVQTNLINVKEYPEASFTVSPVENVPIEMHLANFAFANTSKGATTYKWDFGDGSYFPSTANASHQYQYPGNYTVTLHAINDIGCEDTAVRKFLMVIPDKVLIVPNVFSPNGDGINDKWEIAGLRGVTNCSVEIFNRWGQSIYNSNGYSTPWDGSWKGKPVPIATYYYVIKTATRNYNGWVAIVR
ncbi:T9SS type B sorting domain-containing protein [Niastella caeni]|uniref:T9SS type B sorting domain-containing protein n=1 Tax=Niastella caeni TaxID=2569763 RepID=A0A4S8I0T8_9BACT|nr:PKD domain-containing protein [Niastella caeni]THU39272.1 T9SS type B sorting domain-containing protein [Niastella caeni]